MSGEVEPNTVRTSMSTRMSNAAVDLETHATADLKQDATRDVTGGMANSRTSDTASRTPRDGAQRRGTRTRLRVGVMLVAIVAAVAVWRLGFARDESRGQLAASGTVEATEAQLGFQATGRIETIAVEEGDPVRAGEAIARLDPADAEARRQQALAQSAAVRAQLRELERGSRSEEIGQAAAAREVAREKVRDAERDAARTAQLFEGGAASREQLDKSATALDVARSQERQAEEQLRLVTAGPRRERIEAARAALAQSEAAVATADVHLANMVIRAPFDGIVTVRHREAGEIVQAGSPVLTVMNPDDRWVRIYVPENRLAAVRIGMPAAIGSDTYRRKSYPGEVTFIAREAEFTPKTVQTTEERVKLVYAVKVRVTGDTTGDLKPGMPADVQLRTEAP